MEPFRAISVWAAEPASILYMVTGATGLLLARLRPGKRALGSSVAMLFCSRSSRETMARIELLQSGQELTRP